MAYRRIRDLREDNDYTQDDIAELLNCKRSTYANWENGDVLIPLKKLDELTLIYNVSLSYILDLDNVHYNKFELKPLNYDKLVKNLINLKRANGYSYKGIASIINTSISTCSRYHKDLLIPVDKLILLSKMYKINVDLLCGKLISTKEYQTM